MSSSSLPHPRPMGVHRARGEANDPDLTAIDVEFNCAAVERYQSRDLLEELLDVTKRDSPDWNGTQERSGMDGARLGGGMPAS